MPSDESLPAEFAGDLASIVLPGSGSTVTRMFNAVRNEWSTNRSAALKAAERTAGLYAKTSLSGSNPVQSWYRSSLGFSGRLTMTGQGPLLEAMGAAFGAAVDDLPHVEDYELILGGLRNLRGDDVRILRSLRERDVFFQQSDTAEVDVPRDYQTVRQMGATSAFQKNRSHSVSSAWLVRDSPPQWLYSMELVSQFSDLGRLRFLMLWSAWSIAEAGYRRPDDGRSAQPARVPNQG